MKSLIQHIHIFQSVSQVLFHCLSFVLEMNIFLSHGPFEGFPGGTSGKEVACQCRKLKEMCIGSLRQEDLLEKGMAMHSRILGWRIPRTVQPGGLQSIGSQRVGHDKRFSTSLTI